MFDRYCGMVSAATMLLIIVLTCTLGLYGPLWSKLSASDILTAIIAIIGWIVTVMLGLRAFRLSQHQIALAQKQLEHQQEQLAEAREEVRKSNYARLDSDVELFGRNLDRLITAQGYLGAFTARFPNGRIDGWTRELIMARNEAADFISQSAIAAPFGFGERILTVMTRLQKVGDVLMTHSRSYMPDQPTLNQYDALVMNSIEGLRRIETQIAEDVPKRRVQYVKLVNERETYASKAISL